MEGTSIFTSEVKEDPKKKIARKLDEPPAQIGKNASSNRRYIAVVRNRCEYDDYDDYQYNYYILRFVRSVGFIF